MGITDQEHIAINTEKYFGQSITHVRASFYAAMLSVCPTTFL